MENPNRKLRGSVALIIFGIILGSIPGMIRFDQMRRQVDAELAESTKLNDGLRAAIADEKQKRVAEHEDCQNAILGDGARTILADLNHRYQGPAIFAQTLGVMLEIPDGHREQFAGVPGPIWIVPRAIKPQVLADGVFGGVYTHIWPNGRNDGWHMPARAE